MDCSVEKAPAKFKPPLCFARHGLGALLATASLALGFSMTAAAQDNAANGTVENTAPVEEVVITGSRIPVPANITATSPISVVTSQEVQLEGHTDITDVINNLPQNMINSAVDFGNTSNPLSTPGGIATVDLRGLGPQRTLVLVDGRRLGDGDPNTGNPNPAPDIDQIPAALIERVDVVTGGASAVYGSDAMAGVVNFIMRKDFQGVEVDGQYGFNEHHNHDSYIENQESITGTTPPTGTVRNGDKHDISLIAGTNTPDGNGNVTGYFVYHNQAAVPGSQYDFSDCLLISGFGCDNSANSNQYTVKGSTTPYTVVGSSFLPWPQAGSVPPPTFGSFAYEYNQRQDTRYMGGVMAHLDINDSVKPYLEFSFMNDRTAEVTGPSGLFEGKNTTEPDSNYLVNCSNPLLSAQEISVLQGQGACTAAEIAADRLAPGSENVDMSIGRRNIEGGGRLQYYEHTNYRAVGGLTGNILGADAWTYDAYAQYYYTTLFNSNGNYFNLASVDKALQVTTNTAGMPVCVSGGSCVPYNIFTQGGVTPAALSYLYTPGTAYGTNSEQIGHADVTGELGKYGIISPWAKDGVVVNVGVEHRLESLSFAPDGAELAGDLSGFGGASVPIDNAYTVTEEFAEARAPLVQGKPWADDLSLDIGYRYSDYTTAGDTQTYKFEVQYAPIKDVRFRYSFDRAVRAPNLIELYNPQVVGGTSEVGVDQCAPTVNPTTGALIAATASLTACERTGVTAAQYGNGSTTDTIPQCVANQCSQLLGGNPHLKSEIANTFSLGASLTPTFLPDFQATIDYYHIAIAGEIGSVSANILYDGCLSGSTPSFCSDVVRSADGSINGSLLGNGGYVVQTSINTGSVVVSGVDVGANYRLHLGTLGNLTAQFNGSLLLHDITVEYSGAAPYDCAGLFGISCGSGVNPRWRDTLRLNWDTPWRVLLSADWRLIGSTTFDNNSQYSFLANSEEGAFDTANERIGTYSYIDLAAVVHVVKGIEIRGGINNIFDKDPPLLPADITDETENNSYPSYDTLGREIFVAFTAKF